MKSLFLAAALVALASTSQASAAREPQARGEHTVAVMADAGRLSAAGLTGTRDAAAWEGSGHASANADFDTLSAAVEPGQWLLALGLAGLAAYRPVSRWLRRQEQQRRASALSSTLPRR
ncbi:hypothetical protein [Roseateles sp. LKC17W]|uniref:PEP-CTERM sorting domain-containing protein n=1 Tax=Pelomonas margarita TaxID=3299031 RepID=A0ABW7FKN0_9BURK